MATIATPFGNMTVQQPPKDPLANFRPAPLTPDEKTAADQRLTEIATAKNAQVMGAALLVEAAQELVQLQAAWQAAASTANFAEIFDANFFLNYQNRKAALISVNNPLTNYKVAMHNWEITWETGQPINPDTKRPVLDPAIVTIVLNAGA